MKTDLYVDFTLGVSQDFCPAAPMKGSSVSCCFNGVLKQLTRPSLCEGRLGGREVQSWVDRRTCTEGAPVKLNMLHGARWYTRSRCSPRSVSCGPAEGCRTGPGTGTAAPGQKPNLHPGWTEARPAAERKQQHGETPADL
ncbi:unnamed protein product [Pleuronectes platessa]|uniref:Uncharacterized protein n=1 Tax=Pleuronectes platessa TaxID=8262 RepID=A0A9N7VHJ2_PLEPL|nr:unnamed protein product [Pleuronectes platessa]